MLFVKTHKKLVKINALAIYQCTSQSFKNQDEVSVVVTETTEKKVDKITDNLEKVKAAL